MTANGTVVHRRVFEPFGRVVAESPNPTEPSRQLFTGQEHFAGAGLYDFDARWYDPQVGRFLSVDPVIADLADPQTLNAFSYVGNRPLNFVDPTGAEGVLVPLDPVITALVLASIVKNLIDLFGDEEEDDNWCGMGSKACDVTSWLIEHGHDPEDLAGLSVTVLFAMAGIDLDSGPTRYRGMTIDFKWIVDTTPARDTGRLHDGTLQVASYASGGGSEGAVHEAGRANWILKGGSWAWQRIRAWRAARAAARAATRSLDDLSSLRGASTREIDELIPEGFVKSATRKGGGTRYLNPERPSESIRVMRGNPQDLNPIKRGPYLRAAAAGSRIPSLSKGIRRCHE